MKIKNKIIFISLLVFILLNISFVCATQEADTTDTVMASDITIDEVSSYGELQGNDINEGSEDNGEKLGSFSNENVLEKSNATEPQAQISSDNESMSNVVEPLSATKKTSTQIIAPDRTLYVIDCAYGYEYSAILKDANGKALANKKLSFEFNGVTKTATTDGSGWAKVVLKANVADVYDVKIKFAGDGSYNAASQIAYIKLVQEGLHFVAPDRVVYVRDASGGYTYQVILKDARNKAVNNKKVLLTVNGKKICVVTNNKGYATFKVTLNNEGSYTLALKFAGDRFYKGMVERRTLTLVRETTQIIAPDRVVYICDVIDGYLYQAILKNKNSKALNNKKLTLYINNGNKQSDSTDSSGWALFSIVTGKAGKNTLKIVFEGDKYYKPVTVYKSFTVVDSGNPYGKKAKKIWINSDFGSDDMKNAIVSLLRQNGWTVHVGATHSNAHYSEYFDVTSDYQVYATLYNGFCAGTIREAYSDPIQDLLWSKGVVLVVMWDTRQWTNPDGMAPYRYGDFSGYDAARAWDDNFSPDDPSIKNVADWLKQQNAKYCAYPSADGIVAQFLAGGYFAAHGK